MDVPGEARDADHTRADHTHADHTHADDTHADDTPAGHADTRDPGTGHTDPDHFDAEYYRGNGQSGDRPALRYYTRLVSRYIGEGPYLDFGCGTGHLVHRLSTLGDAAGFEVSRYSADHVREVAPGADVYTSPDDIPSGAFGGITAIHVMEHLTDEIADEAVTTWRRVLRPGGRVLAVIPDPAGRGHELAGEGWVGFTDPTHINLKPHAEWADFLAARGMRVVRQGSDGLWNVPYSRLPKLLDAGLHAVPSLLQFLSGRLFLRPGSGESAIFVLEPN